MYVQYILFGSYLYPRVQKCQWDLLLSDVWDRRSEDQAREPENKWRGRIEGQVFWTCIDRAFFLFLLLIRAAQIGSPARPAQLCTLHPLPHILCTLRLIPRNPPSPRLTYRPPLSFPRLLNLNATSITRWQLLQSVQRTPSPLSTTVSCTICADTEFVTNDL
jgi:hypothetical protein